MLHSWVGRAAAICGLLAVLFALMVGFGTATPASERAIIPQRTH